MNRTLAAVELENPRVERLGEPRLAASAERRFDEHDRRVGERCDRARDLECRVAEAFDPRVQELVEVGGNRELVARRECAASVSGASWRARARRRGCLARSSRA